jgi:hypothetical protein
MFGRNPYITCALVFLFAAGVSPAFGNIVYVDGSVAGPGTGTIGDPYKVLYPTAINAAAVNDTVMVAAGTYPGTVLIPKDLVVIGADPATTIIDGGFGTRAARIDGTTAATLLQGFTIQAGVAIEGAGILMENSASVRNCVIAGNTTTSFNGAGVQVYNGASGSFTNCTFAANVSNGPNGGGALSLQGPGASATLTNCILWDNTPNQIYPSTGSVTVNYSDVQGGGFGGVGNINTDPLFNDAVNGDFTLECTSPCIDAGDPAGTDMGAFEATCTPVNVSGTVTSNCNGALAGVTVDLLDGSGDFYTTQTDVNGAFTFVSLAQDPGDGEISITVPLGYQAGTPSDGEATIVLDADKVQNFTVVCLPPAGTARSKNYWKHEAGVALKGNGTAEESAENMTTNYPNAIFSHFHENALNSIAVEGVTYMAGPLALDIDTIYDTLRKKDSSVQKAKQQYLAVLLNMASGRILPSSVVSTDGATASQAIQYIADLLNGPGSDSLAESIAETMNDASLVGSGVIPLTYDDIAYARRRLSEQPLGVFPNPGSASRDYVFSFGMPAAGEASLEIFDVAGRRVAQPLAGAVEAGWRELRWDGRTLDGRRVGQGVYFARLTTPDGSKSVKFVHVAH